MERATSLIKAKNIFKDNFIGLDELNLISGKIGIYIPKGIENSLPIIPFNEKYLSSLQDDYILMLGIPFYKDSTELTIVKMRSHFGWDPVLYEPCFYNQDWYINETFANNCSIKLKWYIIKKKLIDESRGQSYEKLNLFLNNDQALPSALLTVYTFFAYYFTTGELLWKNDYIWCEDFDHKGDQVYAGRYIDIEGVNKNGFSIHRHLSIRNNYGVIIAKQ